jgi:nicotinamide-nucleotide amidase
VFGEDKTELEHVIVRLLGERSLTLSTIEAGTGGLMAYRISEVDGYRACYRGGIIVPSRVANPAETVGEALIVGSIDTAEETSAAASACRVRFGTDFSLAVSERPEFNPDTMANQAPSLHVSLAGPNGLVETVSQPLLGDLAIVKSRAAKTAFNMLRLRLLDPTRPPAGGNH